MRKNKIRILHMAQAAGGVDRYIRMLLKYLDKEKFENILVCSQDFHEEDYRGLVDSFEQVEMIRAIGGNDLKAIKEVRTLIKKYNPDIVYAHSSKAGAIARIADIGLKNHCVYNPHGWAFNMRCSAKKKAIYFIVYVVFMRWKPQKHRRFQPLTFHLPPHVLRLIAPAPAPCFGTGKEYYRRSF